MDLLARTGDQFERREAARLEAAHALARELLPRGDKIVLGGPDRIFARREKLEPKAAVLIGPRAARRAAAETDLRADHRLCIRRDDLAHEYAWVKGRLCGFLAIRRGARRRLT